MGLYPKFREWLKEQDAERTPDEKKRLFRQLKKDVDGKLEYAPVHFGSVFVEDVLTRLHMMSRPKKGENRYMFTGSEFFNLFMNRVFAMMRDERMHRYIFVMDEQTKVPWTKRNTQRNRSSRHSTEPYQVPDEKDAEPSITDAGIYWPKVHGDHSRGDQFDLQRLMRTRALRPILVEYLIERLRSMNLSGKINARAEIIFDYGDPLGPLCFTAAPDDMGTYMTELKDRRFGEADMQVLEWAKLHQQVDVVISSVDTDMLAILTAYIRRFIIANPFKRRPSVLWQYKVNANALNGSSRWYVNMDKFYQYGLPETDGVRWNIDQFLVYCIFMGTDHYDRGAVMKWLSQRVIQAVIASEPELCTALLNDTTSLDSEINFDALVRKSWTWHISGYVRTNKKNNKRKYAAAGGKNKRQRTSIVMASSRSSSSSAEITEESLTLEQIRASCADSKRLEPPDDATMESACQRFRVNTRYWVGNDPCVNKNETD